MALKDLTGMQFGRLTVIKRIPQNGKTKNARWLCHCSCGNTHEASSSPLLAGKIQSCKCLARELTIAKSTTHGGSRSTEWNSWQSMRQRCTNSKTAGFEHYGGRGIKVCDRWSHSFAAFLEDMGRKPASNYTLDRIDVNGHYEPDNCRWATQKVQCRNKRATIAVAINGQSMPLASLIDEYGIAPQTVRNRLRRSEATETLFRAAEQLHVIGGESKRIDQWAAHFGLQPGTVYMRRRRGWPPEQWFIPLTKPSTR